MCGNWTQKVFYRSLHFHIQKPFLVHCHHFRNFGETICLFVVSFIRCLERYSSVLLACRKLLYQDTLLMYLRKVQSIRCTLYSVWLQYVFSVHGHHGPTPKSLLLPCRRFNLLVENRSGARAKLPLSHQQLSCYAKPDSLNH